MTLRDSNEGLQLAAELLVRLIEARAPPAIIATHLSAQVAGHPKPNDPNGVRPLAIGSVLRRIALKAVCQAFSTDLCDASGPMQFAVGRAGGPELMHKCLVAWTHLRPGAIVLKLDFSNAYNSAIRSAILRAITKHCPHLSPIARCILADETIHWWFGEETVAAAIHAQRGVDQGCPFSPALFAILIADALEAVRDELRALDPDVGILS